ncbi:dGTP triphosphohydrolase [Leptospira sp. GIMC2001]|uniref:dGTP triphosphohydrolase n=1 Tax=Leptospira sp. GIMC2001 TaxID=1513297 RepID=UPI00234A704B|nr:dNTP triphosphohydrolase [Leptospira sp. GIMC2001]WCL51027.1 dNTP triphosphohydrolase [Leptospira sp. GIMC2001]
MSVWKKLMNDERRKTKDSEIKNRTEIERDYDRILFSTPVRRLADKTQVFPLEKNDSIRTRLTHSHEVSNLARSIGTILAYEHHEELKLPEDFNYKRNLPALLATIGLAHDLGNPPFGHQGEKAIQSWFKDNKSKMSSLNKREKNDFLLFEGNAQTFRLLTRLQILDDDYGLNLTFATLASIIKYPLDSYCFTKKKTKGKIFKKHGYFYSEKEIVEEVKKACGLKMDQRHPLTFIMEACDDIAYSVLDAEDSVKKGIVSFSDLIDFLEFEEDDKIIKEVVKSAKNKNMEYKKIGLSPLELNDISMQKFRVFAISSMIAQTKNSFLSNFDNIINGNFVEDLISKSEANTLCKKIKDFDVRNAYKNKSVLEIELVGYQTIRGLMDLIWSIFENEDKIIKRKMKNTTPLAAYIYSRISENYRRVFESKENKMKSDYRKFQLMTDMISGMTDSFAISIHEELKKYA